MKGCVSRYFVCVGRVALGNLYVCLMLESIMVRFRKPLFAASFRFRSKARTRRSSSSFPEDVARGRSFCPPLRPPKTSRWAKMSETRTERISKRRSPLESVRGSFGSEQLWVSQLERGEISPSDLDALPERREARHKKKSSDINPNREAGLTLKGGREGEREARSRVDASFLLAFLFLLSIV